MGNICKKVKLNLSESTFVSKDGVLTKICGEREISFWKQLQELGLVQISKFDSNKSKNSVEFRYSELVYENYIPISQILQYLIIDNNFLYFIKLFEISIAIIDFIQVIFTLKKKYGLNTNEFFMINFDKFCLMTEKGSSKYSKLVYIDEKLNDAYLCPEILFKEENNGTLSFSMQEDSSGISVQKWMSSLKRNSNLKSTITFEMNSCFYSKCNERYQVLRKNYSLEACENFYSLNILNFITKFLIKKTTITHSTLEHQFTNFRSLLRHTISYYFKSGVNYNLHNIKLILTSFYINNFEFCVFKEHIQKCISEGENEIMEKIISYQQSGISLSYGECDVNNPPSGEHKFVFIHDYIINGGYNFTNGNNSHICIGCADSLIKKNTPYSKEKSINMKRFSSEISKNVSSFDVNFFLKYYCSYFENDEKTREILNIIGDEIYIYKKYSHCITFERTHWDKNNDNNEEILNLDYIAKINFKSKKIDKERISMGPLVNK